MCFVYISCPTLGSEKERDMYKAYAHYAAKFVIDKSIGIPLVPIDYLYQYFSETEPWIIRSGNYFNQKMIEDCFMFLSCEDLGVSGNMIIEREIAEKSGVQIFRFEKHKLTKISEGGDAE